MTTCMIKRYLMTSDGKVHDEEASDEVCHDEVHNEEVLEEVCEGEVRDE